jgi:hypothetical protein
MQLSDGGGPDCSIDSPAFSLNGSGSAPIDRLTDEKSPVTGDCHAGMYVQRVVMLNLGLACCVFPTEGGFGW